MLQPGFGAAGGATAAETLWCCPAAQGRSVQDAFEEMLLSAKCHTIQELSGLWLKAMQSACVQAT